MADEYAQKLALATAAHVCESFGFQSAQRSALETLADVMIRYISAVGESAHALTSHAGRTESNVLDTALALRDVGSSIPELMRFFEFQEESPFSVSVPRFPVEITSQLAPSFRQRGETPPSSDLPDWLPALPDQHTYVNSPVWEARGTSEREDKVEASRNKRRAEESLVALHKRVRMITSGSPATELGREEQGTGTSGKQEYWGNGVG